MSSAPQPHSILASALVCLLAGGAATLLAACGQRGPLTIPQTPAAAQRATLPQTLIGRGTHAAPPAAAASATPPAQRAPLLPNVPDLE